YPPPFYLLYPFPILENQSLVVSSSLLFAAGFLGNLIALFILWLHKLHAKKTSVFYVLVTVLTVTNLMGKCLLCPVVQVAYFQNQSLVGMTGNLNLCKVFGFLMIFCGLAPTFILLAMAVDCWLALGYPFFYQENINKKLALLVSLILYVFCLGFCCLPFFGFGRYKQYCPGTWCFIQMTAEESSTSALAYSMLYGTIMGLLILAIVFCNLMIMKNLYQMYKRENEKGIPSANFPNQQEPAGMEELEHLILLAIMTVLFAACSFPLTARVYVGAFKGEKNEYADLTVLRLLSVNSTLDPWIFIICRTSKFRGHLKALCSKIQLLSISNPFPLLDATKCDL
uniref:G-protein coupled receptors family 1 profile domain-containing protein n=1 Tax=Xenopus tropicalis TaxID=8364 RepID=A0A6I8PVP3_XENTR